GPRAFDVALTLKEAAQGPHRQWRHLLVAAVGGALPSLLRTAGVSLLLEQEPKAERRPRRRRRAAAAGDMLEYVLCAFLVALAGPAPSRGGRGRAGWGGRSGGAGRVARGGGRAPGRRAGGTRRGGWRERPGPG